jgi:hypothetical protein
MKFSSISNFGHSLSRFPFCEFTQKLLPDDDETMKGAIRLARLSRSHRKHEILPMTHKCPSGHRLGVSRAAATTVVPTNAFEAACHDPQKFHCGHKYLEELEIFVR